MDIALLVRRWQGRDVDLHFVHLPEAGAAVEPHVIGGGDTPGH